MGSRRPCCRSCTAPRRNRDAVDAAGTAFAPASYTSTAAPVSTQLVAHIAPLQHGPDGIHRLTVHLHPADLGPVQLLAEMRAGTLHLKLVGGSEMAREALRMALPDLRRELTDAGVTTASVDVRREDSAPGQSQSGSSWGGERRDLGGRGEQQSSDRGHAHGREGGQPGEHTRPAGDVDQRANARGGLDVRI